MWRISIKAAHFLLFKLILSIYEEEAYDNLESKEFSKSFIISGLTFLPSFWK